MAECETCGKLFFPDYEAAVGDDEFVHPFKLRDAKQFCGNHGGVEKKQHQGEGFDGFFDKVLNQEEEA
tara:strand:- start:1309 stop:1512 length:204 start_codon:yes stop_codon:yes gene_type:complete